MSAFADSFYEFAALLGLAVGIGFLGRLLKQPLIVSFIAVGLIVGPHGLDLLQSIEKIHLSLGDGDSSPAFCCWS
jgi:Kef-type K+ transport system membrane component KefB